MNDKEDVIKEKYEAWASTYDREIIVDEMKEAGYRLREDLDFLPEQSFTIFSLKK